MAFEQRFRFQVAAIAVMILSGELTACSNRLENKRTETPATTGDTPV